MLNLTFSCCYFLAGFVDVLVAQHLKPEERAIMGLSEEYPPEPVLLRFALLFLMTLCGYGVQVMISHQRQAAEEAREFALREGQLRSAGRLAAEFVHQMKNPLAIINTAAFSLERALKHGRGDTSEQIRIIQEEVERSDRIITQVMGYARLSEGRVERLNIVEELDRAVERAFPPAAGYPVQVHKKYAESFPPLLMQRSHVSEALVNLLTNAREALEPGGGNVWISAQCLPDYTIEVVIEDDGPGIGPDRHERIFEAYYTTKEKGTGLGLATVKNNIELYSGTIRVESELGKGARFTLTFPAKSMMRLAPRA
jgi:two-component system sensor histidine kinase HydH